jgi:phosphoenolpyruvate synthase/pyruvate phosphate dikinase
MELDIQQLISDITDAASNVLKKDVTKIKGFQERQIEGLAKQAKLIATGIASGEIDQDLQKFFIEGLEAMTMNFVRTLRGLVEATVERVWNAVMDVIVKTIGKVVDIIL